MSTTVNISLPQQMYDDAKRFLKQRRYASLSELIREALRGVLYPIVTENGFTPEFEEEVLKAAAEPEENDREWDGVTPFSEFVLSQKSISHDKNKVHRSVSKTAR
ncbi:TPA: hypothetical protein DIV55_00630 [Patescibacteria group bacterium]|nr:hypothetical protein [Patescibacteria group bacterium]